MESFSEIRNCARTALEEEPRPYGLAVASFVEHNRYLRGTFDDVPVCVVSHGDFVSVRHFTIDDSGEGIDQAVPSVPASLRHDLTHNRALARLVARVRHGVKVSLPAGCSFEGAVEIALDADTPVSGTVVLEAGEGVNALVVLKTGARMRGCICVVLVREGARLHIRQEYHTQSISLNVASVKARASLRITEVLPGDGGTYATVARISGDGASAELRGGVRAQGDSKYDILARTEHAANETRSAIRHYGALCDQSALIFRSDISIEAPARAVVSQQHASFDTLSDAVRVDAVPALDIGSHQVRCGHGVSIGPISETFVWYAAARGIGSDDAAQLRIEGKLRSLGVYKMQM